MPIEDIKEIRLFPPLAIGRFGSAESPMGNYDFAEGDSITSRRTVVPAETLIVEQGRIVRAELPSEVTFRDASGRIRPVCPFIEVWARFDDGGSFRPLTKNDIPPESIHWMVSVANRKVQRRTRVANDADLVTATANIEGADHQIKNLDGTSANFLTGKAIRLGSVRYIEPTDDFPEFRLRYRPGHGNVYGFEENDFVNADRVVYDTSPGKGTWHLYDRAEDRLGPVPPDTYRQGILDDSCDGIVEATIPGTNLSALARVSSGPPDFSPDSLHVLTAKDQLMQLLTGPTAATPADAEEREQLVREVVSLLQRALDTVRLMNTGFLNREYYSHLDPVLGRVGAYDPARASNAHVVNRHEAVLSAVGGLTSSDPDVFRAAQQFLPLLLARHRPHTQTWDRQPAVRQLMPAFMRGSDAGDLSITRRQISQINQAAMLDTPEEPTPGEATAASAMRQLVVDMSATGAAFHSAIDAGGGETLEDLFADPDRLMQYLRQAEAKGAAAGSVLGDQLVIAQDPNASAFVKLINGLNPTMNAFFASYTSPVNGKNGIEVVKDWINSLPTA